MVETGRTPIYYNWRSKLKALAAATIVLSLPVGLSLWGWHYHEQQALLIFGGFAAALLAATGRFFYRWFRSIARPAIVILPEGLELESGVILPWSAIRDVVLFKYDGQGCIGIRVRECFEQGQGPEIQRRLNDLPSWFMFKMPWSIDHDSVSIPDPEFLKLLGNRGLTITEHLSEIARGHEDELK